jgi:hypothetical protein
MHDWSVEVVRRVWAKRESSREALETREPGMRVMMSEFERRAAVQGI